MSLAVVRLGRSTCRAQAWALFEQLLRAAVSVQLNIAEGYSFGDSPTFTRHLSVAYGSAVETGELVDLLVDAGVLPASVVADIRERNRRAQRLLLGMLKRRRTFAARSGFAAPVPR